MAPPIKRKLPMKSSSWEHKVKKKKIGDRSGDSSAAESTHSSALCSDRSNCIQCFREYRQDVVDSIQALKSRLCSNTLQVENNMNLITLRDQIDDFLKHLAELKEKLG